MVGFLYNGITDQVFALELTHGIFLDPPAQVLFPAEIPTLALRWQGSFLRERLKLVVAGLFMGWTLEYGWLARAELHYELQDGLQVSLGYITYQPGSEFSLLTGLSSHDRLSAGLRWDFTLL